MSKKMSVEQQACVTAVTQAMEKLRETFPQCDWLVAWASDWIEGDAEARSATSVEAIRKEWFRSPGATMYTPLRLRLQDDAAAATLSSARDFCAPKKVHGEYDAVLSANRALGYFREYRQCLVFEILAECQGDREFSEEELSEEWIAWTATSFHAQWSSWLATREPKVTVEDVIDYLRAD